MARITTAAMAKKLKLPGRHSVEGAQGLYLWVKPTGARSWLLRVKAGGQRLDRGLGSAESTSLAEAKRRAESMRVQLREKPARARPTRRAHTREGRTFESVAMDFFDEYHGGWGPDHTRNWRESMSLHVFPILGARPVDTISRTECLSLLAPLARRVNVTARRLQQRMAAVFEFAVAHELRSDNPCDRAILRALPKPSKVEHLAAVHHSEVEGVLGKVFGARCQPETKLALGFLVLTACRSGEVRGARWEEFDNDWRTWTIPGSRMKAGEAHRVPLSEQSRRILAWLWKRGHGLGGWASAKAPSADALVFPGHGGLQMRGGTFLKVLHKVGLSATAHGFRSSFRDWAAESTTEGFEVIERSLAHKVGGAVVAAYFRSDLLERRRELMQSWADYVAPMAAGMCVAWDPQPWRENPSDPASNMPVRL